MNKPELADDEAKRMAELDSLKILDNEAGKVFNGVTLLASIIFHMPILLVSLVDKRHQWLKSKVRLNVDVTPPREVSSYVHAVHSQEISEVCDSGAGERFERVISKPSKQIMAAQEVAKIKILEFNLATHDQASSLEHYKIIEIESPQQSAVLYKIYRDRMHPEARSCIDVLFNRHRRFGEGFSCDCRVFFNDSDPIKWLRKIGQAFKNDLGEMLLRGACQHRREKIRLGETQDKQGAKAMESQKISLLGAGIAHEISSPIVTISGIAELSFKYRSRTKKNRVPAAQPRIGRTRDVA